ncbi:hypothetical protein PM082_020173 [Marasmius tenuissimus]|nr:hypothetical protein PM082_020173 [Marasmius tenuissimus]
MPPFSIHVGVGQLFRCAARTEQHFHQAVETIKICVELHSKLEELQKWNSSLDCTQLDTIIDHAKEALSGAIGSSTLDPFEIFYRELKRILGENNFEHYRLGWERAKKKDVRKREIVKIVTAKLKGAMARTNVDLLVSYFPYSGTLMKMTKRGLDANAPDAVSSAMTTFSVKCMEGDSIHGLRWLCARIRPPEVPAIPALNYHFYKRLDTSLRNEQIIHPVQSDSTDWLKKGLKLFLLWHFDRTFRLVDEAAECIEEFGNIWPLKYECDPPSPGSLFLLKESRNGYLKLSSSAVKSREVNMRGYDPQLNNTTDTLELIQTDHFWMQVWDNMTRSTIEKGVVAQWELQEVPSSTPATTPSSAGSRTSLQKARFSGDQQETSYAPFSSPPESPPVISGTEADNEKVRPWTSTSLSASGEGRCTRSPATYTSSAPTLTPSLSDDVLVIPEVTLGFEMSPPLQATPDCSAARTSTPTVRANPSSDTLTPNQHTYYHHNTQQTGSNTESNEDTPVPELETSISNQNGNAETHINEARSVTATPINPPSELQDVKPSTSLSSKPETEAAVPQQPKSNSTPPPQLNPAQPEGWVSWAWRKTTSVLW